MAEGPSGEREAVDLGVVTDIDGEFLAEEKGRDRGGVGMRAREGTEFAGEGAGGGGVFDFRFDDEGGALVGPGAEADQGAAGGTGMGAEDLFTGLGMERAGGGLDAFGFAPAEPETTVDVAVTAVAEAMPDRAAGGDAEGARGKEQGTRAAGDGTGAVGRADGAAGAGDGDA